MGLFGGRKEEHPNLDFIAESVRIHLGLQLTPPGDDVVAVLDQFTSRELHNFDNLHSIEGMQELFRARSLRAHVEPETQSVTLSVATEGDLEQEIAQEHAQRRVFHFEGQHRPAAHVHVQPQDAPMLGATRPAHPLAMGGPTATAPALPAALEHLEAMERLLPQVTDVFLRFGRLNSGDKEVLKKILPMDSSIEARLTALERWQAEVTHRMRGLRVPHAQGHVMLGGETAQQQAAKPEESQKRRFDAFALWMAKLIKAFEHTGGVKFHNKPMWLPHV
jgi:hypothetical protein